MRVISLKMLKTFWSKHADAESPLRLWFKIAEKTTWRNFTEVRGSFPSADTAKVASGNTVVIFDIGGNKYRLIAAIHYNTGCVYALRVMTHAEYSKNKWMDPL
jgi:mRNA interferase HigB